MPSLIKSINVTHRFTNFVATCNDCAWFSPADTLSIDKALHHAAANKHNVTVSTTTYATIYGISAKISQPTG
jgi:hypothetical protein